MWDWRTTLSFAVREIDGKFLWLESRLGVRTGRKNEGLGVETTSASPAEPESSVVRAGDMGREVNSVDKESRASLASNGRRFYFGSTRAGRRDSDLSVASRR